MAQEAVIICVDNSDWSRNGDFEPTRWEAQAGAANIIIEQKCEKNAENCVGIISMAGKRVQVHSTLTTDQSRVLNAIKAISLSGESDFLTSLNIAHLTLKHRQNKNQKQRIIMFICSPIRHSVEDMNLVGRKLKKYNVSVDIISYGNVEENAAHVKALYDSVNNNNTSHVLEVLPGFYLVDSLFSSPIINSEMEGFEIPNEANNIPAQTQPANASAAGQGVGMSQFEKDINIAIQNSLLEEQKKKEEEAKKHENQSMNIASKEVTAGTPAKETPAEEDFEDEEKAMEEARLLSIQVHEENLRKKTENEKKEKSEFLQDENFIKDVLKEINNTGGEVDDLLVKEVMDKLKNDDEKKETNNDENKKEG